MNDSGEIRHLIRPIFRMWWLILACMIAGLIYGYNRFQNHPPLYQARSSLQIDDAQSSNAQFLAKFESFSLIGEYTSELGIMRSDYMIRKAYAQLDVGVFYYRKQGNLWQNLYGTPIFTVHYSFENVQFLDKLFLLEMDESEKLHLGIPVGEEWEFIEVKLGEDIRYGGMSLQIGLDSAAAFPMKPGLYAFTVNSGEALEDLFTSRESYIG